MADIDFTDNSAEVLAALAAAKGRILERIGQRAERNVVMRTPVGTPESTGVEGYQTSNLRGSISHEVQGDAVYVGTNHDYAPYAELGTGIFASEGNGRKTPWVWIDKNGKAHKTRGMKPRHMLKKGVEESMGDFQRIIEDEMKC